MVKASDIYTEYEKRGGLTGLLKEKINFYTTSWIRHKLVLDKVKEAREIYLKIFPHGRPPGDANEVIRRTGIIAAYLARLKKRKDKRYRNLNSLYKKYREIEYFLKEYRSFYSETRHFLNNLNSLLVKLDRAKVIANSKQSARIIFEVIYNFLELLKEILTNVRKYKKLYVLYRYFRENYNYASLWVEFKYVMTVDYEDVYFGYRSLEIYVRTWSHAELLYHPSTNETMQNLFEEILYETKNDWLLRFPDVKDIFSYLSKEILGYKWGNIPKTFPFVFTLYDHNYGFVRIYTTGNPRIPRDWQIYDAKTLKHEWILKRGDIEYVEARGERGRIKGTAVKTRKKVDNKEIIVIKGYRLPEGIQRSITEFLKKHSLKKETKKET